MKIEMANFVSDEMLENNEGFSNTQAIIRLAGLSPEAVYAWAARHANMAVKAIRIAREIEEKRPGEAAAEIKLLNKELARADIVCEAADNLIVRPSRTPSLSEIYNNLTNRAKYLSE